MHYTGPGDGLVPLHSLHAECDEGVLTITLQRPAQRNLVDVALTLEMQALLAAVHDDAEVRVVVLRGAGSGFCGGVDQRDFEDATRHDAASLRAARRAANEWRVRRLHLLPQPVIAMVHGFCEGGALAVLDGCDIVFAADDCAFSLPDAPGEHRVDGAEAERLGLVTRSLPHAELEAHTYALARELAAKDALALQFTKETLLHVPAMSWDGALNFTAAKFAELKALQAGRPSARAAAVASFLEGKSKPGLGA